MTRIYTAPPLPGAYRIIIEIAATNNGRQKLTGCIFELREKD